MHFKPGFLVGGFLAAIFFGGEDWETQKNNSWNTKNGGLEDDFPLSIGDYSYISIVN